jgi:hypothetical protein
MAFLRPREGAMEVWGEAMSMCLESAWQRGQGPYEANHKIMGYVTG